MSTISRNSLAGYFQQIRENISLIPNESKRYGKVSTVIGTVVECIGLQACVGEIYRIHTQTGKTILSEVVGIRGEETLLMPYDRIEGMKAGCPVEISSRPLTLGISDEILGRVIDADGLPIDEKGPFVNGEHQPIHNEPPGPLERVRIDKSMVTGIRAIDALNTIGQGQRMGIFAGSGVGKSVLMGMIARRSSADVNVIALIGERGREVSEFISDSLGEEGLSRSVVVAVTSDMAAMSRIKGASTATAVAEYFRDKGKNVLLMMDSVTRVAMAQREIGLASGEPPTTKGYTPSVFAMLPKLLERAGKTRHGSITGLYTVLVDNDDMNEPIADAVRSILDGHIVLSRRLAHKNHYPAIDVLESVSRVMPNIIPLEDRTSAMAARELLATYREAEDLINIGAYVKGSNPKIDEAVKKNPDLESFLKQSIEEQVDSNEDYWSVLKNIVEQK
ncbi:MAG: FliI/YscN family ATPase [Balneolales bacterium]